MFITSPHDLNSLTILTRLWCEVNERGYYSVAIGSGLSCQIVKRILFPCMVVLPTTHSHLSNSLGFRFLTVYQTNYSWFGKLLIIFPFMPSVYPWKFQRFRPELPLLKEELSAGEIALERNGKSASVGNFPIISFIKSTWKCGTTVEGRRSEGNLYLNFKTVNNRYYNCSEFYICFWLGFWVFFCWVRFYGFEFRHSSNLRRSPLS